ncbi:MAG TPA: hypothetical protein VMS08_01465 [Candidatus Saccharimonadia bacterium]|nr:hypothetical protein [Candidatus Saccharimonadia bacterium]
MRVIQLRFSSKQFSLDNLWHRVSDVETYPGRIKYCLRSYDVDFRAGGSYTDVTTLLWFPLTINHRIDVANYPAEIQYYLALPFGGSSRQTYRFERKDGVSVVLVEVEFDLGNPFFTRFVGNVLSRRLVAMLQSGFPEDRCEVLKAT